MDAVLQEVQERIAHCEHFVTLTYAQSLDARIGIRNGRQLVLSGDLSMTMTHKLRALHDGILVGIGTVLNDNPSLNVRLVPVPSKGQPRPIVLDTQLRTPLDCKLIHNYKCGVSPQPWIITSSTVHETNADRVTHLESAGARIIPITSTTQDDTYALNLSDVIHTLNQPDYNIRSIMIEGGASVIQSCLQEHIMDALIITMAPLFIGPEGVAVQANAFRLPRMQYTPLGEDIIIHGFRDSS